MDSMIGVYIIISPSAKIYVGQTIDFQRRKRQYKNRISKNQIKVFNSFKKYGYENHYFEMIEECSVNELNERERYWQEEYEVLGEYGLNCRLTKTTDKTGYVSDEVKRKLSELKKGKRHSESHKENISKSNKGRKLSNFTKEKMKNKSVELKAKLSKLFKGVPRSEETKRKISEAHLNRKKNNLVNI